MAQAQPATNPFSGKQLRKNGGNESDDASLSSSFGSSVESDDDVTEVGEGITSNETAADVLAAALAKETEAAAAAAAVAAPKEKAVAASEKLVMKEVEAKEAAEAKAAEKETAEFAAAEAAIVAEAAATAAAAAAAAAAANSPLLSSMPESESAVLKWDSEEVAEWLEERSLSQFEEDVEGWTGKRLVEFGISVACDHTVLETQFSSMLSIMGAR